MSVVPYPFSQSDMTSASQVLRISSALPSVNIVKNGANLLTLQPIITLNTAGTYLISIKIDLTIIIGTTAITLINPTVDYGFFYYLTPINISTQPQPPVLDIFSGSNVVGRMSLLLNRKVLSAELSKDYYNIGCKMLENAIEDYNQEDLDVINELAFGKVSEAELIEAA